MSTRIPSRKARTVLFLSVMRHHADWLRGQGWRVGYIGIDAREAGSLGSGLAHAIEVHRPRRRFPPDTTTRDVVAAVERHFGDNPGQLDDFDWPVTREQAIAALDDFVDHRLAAFSPFQDASWDGEPTL